MGKKRQRLLRNPSAAELETLIEAGWVIAYEQFVGEAAIYCCRLEKTETDVQKSIYRTVDAAPTLPVGALDTQEIAIAITKPEPEYTETGVKRVQGMVVDYEDITTFEEAVAAGMDRDKAMAIPSSMRHIYVNAYIRQRNIDLRKNAEVLAEGRQRRNDPDLVAIRKQKRAEQWAEWRANNG